MTQENFIDAIKKQQTLIRRLISSRRHRSDVIQELTEERYKHLVGRFFRPQGDRFKDYDYIDYYYIAGITTTSNYIMSDEVQLHLDCRFISKSYMGTEMSLFGFYISSRSFSFKPQDNLDEMLTDMLVDHEEAIDTIKGYTNELVKNLLEYGGKF